MLLYGSEKVGKSFLAIQLAVAIATGTPFLGFEVKQRGPVVYVQLDTPRALWLDRLDKLRESGVAVDAVHYVDRETLNEWPWNSATPEHAEKLARDLLPVKPVAVIIDTLRESHQGEENSNTEMPRAVSNLVAITQPAALILVHHARKGDPEKPDDIRRGSRGANYLTGRMDSILRLSEENLHYIGRSVEEGTIRLSRTPNLLWDAVDAAFEKQLEDIILIPGLSTRERARLLSERTGRSVEACRSLLQRRGV
jgi:RecA-family ATPase